MIPRPLKLVLVCASLSLGASCRLWQRQEPVGLSKVKSVGKPASEWKDGAGGTWRLAVGRKVNWKFADARCKSLAESYEQRWRLPSPEELVAARENGISTTANASFGWVRLSGVWTAERETPFDEDISAVYVDMDQGTTLRTTFDDLALTALCVRSDDNGQVWSDGQGRKWWYLPVRIDFETAVASCAELARRQHKPWHVPTSEELVDAAKNGIQGRENKAFGRDFLTYAWTGDVAPHLDSEEAFAVDLRNGNVHVTDVDEELSVVCALREEKPKEKAKTKGKAGK